MLQFAASLTTRFKVCALHGTNNARELIFFYHFLNATILSPHVGAIVIALTPNIGYAQIKLSDNIYNFNFIKYSRTSGVVDGYKLYKPFLYSYQISSDVLASPSSVFT